MHRLIAAALLLLTGPAWAVDRPPAEIIAFQGRTDVRETLEGEWQPAYLKQPLAALGMVRTGVASWALLLFIDQTQIKVSANSLFRVKAVSRDGHGPTIVEMRKGKAWTPAPTSCTWAPSCRRASPCPRASICCRRIATGPTTRAARCPTT